MDKKLPGIFANKITKKLNNNKDFYYSKEDKEEIVTKNKKDKNVNQKIKELFKANDYVYKVDAEITYDNKTVTKKIIGYNSKNLITYDNELIPIDKITDIRKL